MEEQVGCPCDGQENDFYFCPIIKGPCKKDNCMMFVWIGRIDKSDDREWGRCGLVNTIYINSTGCGE